MGDPPVCGTRVKVSAPGKGPVTSDLQLLHNGSLLDAAELWEEAGVHMLDRLFPSNGRKTWRQKHRVLGDHGRGTLGYSTCAFVRVAVEGQRQERSFVELVLIMPEIEECHRISGEFPVLLKMWAHDLQHLERVLDATIRTQSGVVRTEVSIVLSSPKDHVTGLTLGPENR